MHANCYLGQLVADCVDGEVRGTSSEQVPLECVDLACCKLRTMRYPGSGPENIRRDPVGDKRDGLLPLYIVCFGGRLGGNRKSRW